MKKGNIEETGISELKPRRLFQSELAEKGKIVVLVPQQKNFLAELFSTKKNRINDRVKLDFLGSFVWNQCDGVKTVKDIANKLKQEYGKYAEPVDKTVQNCINQLHLNRLIDIEKY
jgi:hypothetical protein